MSHHSDHYCAQDESPYCPWYCPVHGRHHPVITMVEHCVNAEVQRLSRDG